METDRQTLAALVSVLGSPPFTLVVFKQSGEGLMLARPQVSFSCYIKCTRDTSTCGCSMVVGGFDRNPCEEVTLAFMFSSFGILDGDITFSTTSFWKMFVAYIGPISHNTVHTVCLFLDRTNFSFKILTRQANSAFACHLCGAAEV